jgi:hypothetical protein
LIFQFLDTDGTGTGEYQILGDYSTQPEEFFYLADEPTVITLAALTMICGQGTFSQTGYGPLPELPNGILPYIDRPDGHRIPLMAGALTSTADWLSIGTVAHQHSWGQGERALQIFWAFDDSGTPMFLPAGYKLGIEVNDAFNVGAPLLSHTIMIHGFQVSDNISKVSF